MVSKSVTIIVKFFLVPDCIGNLVLNRAQYFYRIAVFTRENDQVIVLDLHNPQMSTPLDEWLGTVVSLADGQHTVADLIAYIGSQYPAGPPEELGRTLESIVDRLVEANAIRLGDEPVDLPYYLALPACDQDVKKAKELMIIDGYLKQ